MLICHQNLWRSEENMGKKRYSRAQKKSNKNDSMKEKPTKAIRYERDREKQRKKKC